MISDLVLREFQFKSKCCLLLARFMNLGLDVGTASSSVLPCPSSSYTGSQALRRLRTMLLGLTLGGDGDADDIDEEAVLMLQVLLHVSN